MNDDAQWLNQYAREGSEPAFRKLVERYIALVNSTARRMTGGNAHLAQDVTQLVFTDLARKAGSLPRGTILGGWLHRHTCYTALKALRTENRRHQRERIAMELNAINDNSGQDAHWLELAPVLDDALNRLSTPDRAVIVLRYFQQQDIRSIGQDLGATETAVQKRLGRALEKLRAILTRRGVTMASATVLGTALDAGMVTSIPTGLIAAVSTTAVDTAGTAGTALTLLTLHSMVTSKLTLRLAAIVIVAGTIAVIISHHNTASTPAIAPMTPTAPATSSTAKISPAAVAVAAKVEAPKLAPAPAGSAPATPAEIAATKATLNGSNTYTGMVIVSGPLMVNVAPVNTYPDGSSLQQMKANLESFRQELAATIEQKKTAANGNPAELAKIEFYRQEYENMAEEKQKQIDDLEAHGVPDGTGGIDISKGVRAQQLQQLQTVLERLKQQGGPANEWKIEALQNQIDGITAQAAADEQSTSPAKSP